MLTKGFLKGLYFSPDDKGGAGGTPNDGNPAGQSGAAGAQGNPPPDKNQVTFTPEQQKVLNEMFAERAKQGGAAALTELFSSLSVKDSNELKSLLNEAKKLKDAQKSEAEKQAEREAGLKTQNETLIKELDGIKAQLRETLLKGAVLAEAMKHNFYDVNDAWLHIDRAAITEKDGKFENVEKLVEAIAKAKPHLIKSQQSGGMGTPPPPRGAKPQGAQGSPQTPVVRVNF